jgi:hypothetical protein
MTRPDDMTLFPARRGSEEGPGRALHHGDVPAIVTQSAAGAAARYAWEEFFDGELPNRHTRAAYSRGAGTHPITIQAHPGETIDGAKALTIRTNYGVLRVISSGKSCFGM